MQRRAGRLGHAAALVAGAVICWLLRVLRMRARLDWAQPGGRSHLGTLHARVVGGGEDTVVLVHGLSASNLYWGERYNALGDDALLVVPDLLGFGASPRPDVDYGPDDHADALAATLTELGVNRPALLVAHSTGCLVALRLAARHPRLVAGVVGFGPPLYRDRQIARQRMASLGLLARLFATDTRLSRRLCAWVCCTQPEAAARVAQVVRADLPAPIARDGVRYSWASYHGTLRRVVLASDAPAWLPAITVPVHLVVGADDRVADIAFLHELAREHSCLSVSVWPGTDHDEPLVNPGRCLEEVRSFRNRTTQGARIAVATDHQ
ncbi:MAG: alpha/beta hydrolase [Actinobacteria bacterium]|nr:alpha/beta hydrolase [Actinomycetota bacterium]MBW3615129.1 alpha/beta hydrolase [Actinomycetota bacterium]